MWEDNSHLQPPATTHLVGLQSLVRFWSLHQQYKVLRKGFETDLSKQQISNMLANQQALHAANVFPLTSIDTFSGVRSGKIKDFYDDCQDIPDPSTLDPMKKNLLLFDDCFLGKQNKAEAYYTREAQQLRYDIHCTELLPSTPTYSSRVFKLYNPVPTRYTESNTYPC